MRLCSEKTPPPPQPLNVYRLRTVIVITTLYLITACLRKLSEEEVQNYSEACQALNHDFYVDNFHSSAASQRDALKLRGDLISVLRKAGLELCK